MVKSLLMMKTGRLFAATWRSKVSVMSMSDLVERLQELATHHNSHAGGHPARPTLEQLHEKYCKSALDAIAEIERLEGENKRLKKGQELSNVALKKVSDYVERLEQRIDELEQQWISVEDRLPEPHKPYSHTIPVIAVKTNGDNTWSEPTTFDVGSKTFDCEIFNADDVKCVWVTLWMPLPKPPENSDD
jgi:hypothetical protein